MASGFVVKVSVLDKVLLLGHFFWLIFPSILLRIQICDTFDVKPSHQMSKSDT